MSNGNRKTKQAIETMTNRAKNAYQHCSVLELPDALDVDINELISTSMTTLSIRWMISAA